MTDEMNTGAQYSDRNNYQGGQNNEQIQQNMYINTNDENNSPYLKRITSPQGSRSVFSYQGKGKLKQKQLPIQNMKLPVQFQENTTNMQSYLDSYAIPTDSSAIGDKDQQCSCDHPQKPSTAAAGSGRNRRVVGGYSFNSPQSSARSSRKVPYQVLGNKLSSNFKNNHFESIEVPYHQLNRSVMLDASTTNETAAAFMRSSYDPTTASNKRKDNYLSPQPLATTTLSPKPQAFGDNVFPPFENSIVSSHMNKNAALPGTL